MDIPKSRITILVIILLTIGSSCFFLSGRNPSIHPTNEYAPTVPKQTPAILTDQTPLPTQFPSITITQTITPNEWKVSLDPGGSCQVSTPPNWKLGVDFFLESEQMDKGPFESVPGQFAPMVAPLWANQQIPEGHQYQIRASLVNGGHVCSVWRIREDTNFTAEEKIEMEQVGKTLQEVHR
jgi:hypothetical protein